jgi:hypothetical protein
VAALARISWFCLLIGVAVAGCADRYAVEAQRRTIESQNIPPQHPKADLLAFMRTYLNNPENLRSAAMSDPQKLIVEQTERYAACLRFDAKNSAGRYLGVRDHLAVFMSGKFDRLIDLGRGSEGGGETHRALREFCATAAYQPFPELEQLRR